MAGRFSIETVFHGRDMGISRTIRRITAGSRSMGQRLSRDLAQAQAGFTKINSTITATARSMAMLAAGGGFAAYNIGKTGAEFEQAITNVAAVSLRSREEIAALEAEAKRLGATTKFTATEAANAMEVMVRAGFKDSAILAGVGPILSAAAASGLEIAEVADHVSDALKGMGLEATEAATVADVLALASSKTNSSIGSLGESLSNVSSTARKFKIPLTDVVTSVALLQDVGLDASVAGSAMNTMLTQMAAPSESLRAKMKELDVTFEDSHGNMLPFVQVLEQLKKGADAAGGNMKQVAFIAELVGLRGQKAASNLADLLNPTGDQISFSELSDALNKAKDSAQKMAEIRMNTLQGDVTLLGSAIDAVKVALFETESGPLRGIIQSITAWVTANQQLIVSGFQEFMTDLREALPTIVLWLERIAKVLAVFYTFAAAVKFATVAVGVFNAIMAANPLTLWIYGLMAAIALIWAFWPEISEFFGKLWAGLSDWASGVWATIKRVFTAIGEFVVGAVAIMISPWVAYGKMVMAIFQPLVPFFTMLWDGITFAVTAAIDLWLSHFRRVFGQIKSIVKPIVAFFTGIWTAIADAFQRHIGSIIDKVSGMVELIRRVGRHVMSDGAPAEGDGDPGVVGPEQRGARAAAKENAAEGGAFKGELNVRADPGTKVTARTRGRSPVKLKVAHSGAF